MAQVSIKASNLRFSDYVVHRPYKSRTLKLANCCPQVFQVKKVFHLYEIPSSTWGGFELATKASSLGRLHIWDVPVTSKWSDYALLTASSSFSACHMSFTKRLKKSSSFPSV